MNNAQKYSIIKILETKVDAVDKVNSLLLKFLVDVCIALSPLKKYVKTSELFP